MSEAGVISGCCWQGHLLTLVVVDGDWRCEKACGHGMPGAFHFSTSTN